MRRISISWVALLLTLTIAVGCRQKDKSTSVQTLSLELPEVTQSDTPWLLYIFGKQSVTLDTLEIKAKKGIQYSQAYDLDTIDLMLLKDSIGALALPILPQREGSPIKARLRDGEWQLSGLQYPQLIQEWHKTKEESEGALISFLRDHSDDQVVLLMVVDGFDAYGTGERASEWSSLYREVAMGTYELSNLLGMRLSAEYRPTGSSFAPYTYEVSGQKERLTYRELMGKQALMALNVFTFCPDDSATFAQQKHYLEQLDSLSIPSYSVLLNDSLPKGIKPKSKGTKRYFLIDSIGESQRFIRQQYLQELPQYMVVDSLRNIKGSWNSCDSLIKYIKEYKEKK